MYHVNTGDIAKTDSLTVAMTFLVCLIKIHIYYEQDIALHVVHWEEFETRPPSNNQNIPGITQSSKSTLWDFM